MELHVNKPACERDRDRRNNLDSTKLLNLRPGNRNSISVHIPIEYLLAPRLCLYATALHCDCTTLRLHHTATALHCDCTTLRLHYTVTALHCDCITLRLHYTATAPHCDCTTLRRHHTATAPHCDCTTLRLHYTVTALHTKFSGDILQRSQ
jgi:hypothetical protein